MTSRTGLIKTCIVTLISLMHISWWGMSNGAAATAQFTSDFVKKISQEYGLRVYGSGMSFPVKLESIILIFEADYCKDISGARQLIVAIAHQMIEKMNQDVKLQKYLSSIPATVKNVDLTIYFKEVKEGQYPGLLNSVMIIGVRNKVVFSTLDETRKKIVDLHRETFDEAEWIMQQESQSSSNVIKPSNDK